MTSLSDAQLVRTLDRLHAEARGDWKHFISILPHALWGRVRGKSFMKTVTPAQFRNIYVPVSRDAGRFLYVLARGSGARKIVEFGSSFGISTIYLAAAVRDNGGGLVVTTEIEESKCRTARANLKEAGVADVVQLMEGDARETLKAVEGPIDLVFLDGWKDLYVPILRLIRPKLRPGAVIVADNTNMSDTRPYLEHVRAPENGFTSTPLYGGTMELSCLTGEVEPLHAADA